jgi:hypothetical protein
VSLGHLVVGSFGAHVVQATASGGECRQLFAQRLCCRGVAHSGQTRQPCQRLQPRSLSRISPHCAAVAAPWCVSASRGTAWAIYPSSMGSLISIPTGISAGFPTGLLNPMCRYRVPGGGKGVCVPPHARRVPGRTPRCTMGRYRVPGGGKGVCVPPHARRVSGHTPRCTAARTPRPRAWRRFRGGAWRAAAAAAAARTRTTASPRAAAPAVRVREGRSERHGAHAAATPSERSAVRFQTSGTEAPVGSVWVAVSSSAGGEQQNVATLHDARGRSRPPLQTLASKSGWWAAPPHDRRRAPGRPHHSTTPQA